MEDTEENHGFDDSIGSFMCGENKNNHKLYSLDMLMKKSKNRLAEKKEKRGSMYPYPYKVQPERIPDIVEERKRSLDTISMPQMSRNRCPSRDDPDLYIK